MEKQEWLASPLAESSVWVKGVWFSKHTSVQEHSWKELGWMFSWFQQSPDLMVLHTARNSCSKSRSPEIVCDKQALVQGISSTSTYEICKEVWNNRFLWRGKLEKLKIDEIDNPVLSCGLNLPCIFSKADSLFLSQTCKLLIDPTSKQNCHVKYWLGLYLREYFPDMSSGPHAELLSPYFQHKKRLSTGRCRAKSAVQEFNNFFSSS